MLLGYLYLVPFSDIVAIHDPLMVLSKRIEVNGSRYLSFGSEISNSTVFRMLKIFIIEIHALRRVDHFKIIMIDVINAPFFLLELTTAIDAITMYQIGTTNTVDLIL